MGSARNKSLIKARRDTVRQARRGSARLHFPYLGSASHRHGVSRREEPGRAWPVTTGLSLSRRGETWPGEVRRDKTGRGLAPRSKAGHGEPPPSMSGRCGARSVVAGLPSTRQDFPSLLLTWHVPARQNAARPGQARRGMAPLNAARQLLASQDMTGVWAVFGAA